MSQELDVTKSLQYKEKLSSETGTKVTLTHILVRALALGLAKFPEIQGHLKFGNFDQAEKLGMVVASNVDSGKDLVPIEFHDF